MKKVFYEKVGDEFIPVREYDSELMDSLPEGSHLVVCKPGGRSTRYNINPDRAPLLAAFRTLSDKISREIVTASEMRPERSSLTEAQGAAWEAFADTMEDSKYYCQYPSAQEITDNVVKYVNEQITATMQADSVKKAYENFELMFKLAAGEQDEI